MLTVNSLPLNYPGKVHIVINDREPIITVRNLSLLMLLRDRGHPLQAADLALHLWYSAFVPGDHHMQLLALVTELTTSLKSQLKAGHGDLNLDFSLGTNARLQGSLPRELLRYLSSLIMAHHSPEKAHAEMQRVTLVSFLCTSSSTNSSWNYRMAERRRDNLDNRLAELSAAHRLSIVRFRRYGLLYPYGAMNAHFNTPNHLLFNINGSWMQNDGADPLHSWEYVTISRLNCVANLY